MTAPRPPPVFHWRADELSTAEASLTARFHRLSVGSQLPLFHSSRRTRRALVVKREAGRPRSLLRAVQNGGGGRPNMVARAEMLIKTALNLMDFDGGIVDRKQAVKRCYALVEKCGGLEGFVN